ncbi:MAG: outer membrane lipoprotein carrier protein LolA [Victivallales bacterium]|nr:outer membrane lipoprotein carrier protein LolA [Victivallales bacterium]
MRILMFALCMITCFCLCDDAAWERIPGMLRPIKGKLEADFTLVRHFKDMDFDMNGSGSMTFTPGRELIFRTEKPMKTVCTLTPTQVALNDVETGKTTAIKSEQQPWISQLFQLQDCWLRGDVGALKAEFDAVVQDGNTLLFTPKNAKMQAFVKTVQLSIEPRTRHIVKVVMTEASGDSITLIFSNICE